ncbi:hypothetical protein [Furfurilactobacillus cerevisiae]|uniref:hypothetical protein n=1 Tax=Furfurilactobacillus rossiae TaxID=231049 RepID=UPI003B980BA5
MTTKAYLQVTMHVANENREAAANVYTKYKEPFLNNIKGATSSKELLIRDEDVQVQHGFDNAEDAAAYLKSDLFTQHVFKELSAQFEGDPEVRIYTIA